MESLHVPGCAPAPPRSESPELRIYVVYTTPAATRIALRRACVLAKDLVGSIRLLLAKIVPFPRQLESPTCSTEYTEDRLRHLAGICDVDLAVQVLLCRDREETIPQWLPAQSIVVVGRRRRWGPGSFSCLIRAIRRKGHSVLVVDERGWSTDSVVVTARRIER
jgi:hypothetical protein